MALKPVHEPIPGSEYWRFVRFIELGLVKDMAEAKAMFGGSPVLQEVRG